MQLRYVHRVIAIGVVLATLYLGITGSLIQAIDVRTLITNAAPFDPNLMAMRAHFAGPPNFRVLATADYLADPLPFDANLSAMLETVVTAVRGDLGDAPLKFVELRIADGRPVGQVKFGERELRFDANSGTALGPPPAGLNDDDPPPSPRRIAKNLHRMSTFGALGHWWLWISFVVSIALVTLVVTGVILYSKLLQARWRSGRTNLFWIGGGWWRALHRSIAIAAAVFVSVQALSGAWLSFEDLSFWLYSTSHHTVMSFGQVVPGGPMFDASSPLSDQALPGMLASSISAYSEAMPGVPPRVVRLRNYGGMGQGVIISGGAVPEQLVFDTASGRRLSLTEPGYPPTGFPFGWQAHQTAKRIHRGDIFGLPGRLMSFLAALALVYLSVSGFVMYWTMWRNRLARGRRSLFWK